MHTATRIAAYATTLAVAFGGAWTTGALLRPSLAGSTTSAGAHGHGGGSSHRHDESGLVPQGLATEHRGYTLIPESTVFPRAQQHDFAFRITGPNRKTVTRFDVEHDKRMHLILVRRDGTGFQHVHPTMGPGGTWRVPLRIEEAGSYRIFADFAPTGAPHRTLGVDLFVPGEFTPATPPHSRLSVVDGYEIRLEGTLTAGLSSRIRLHISKNGRPVTDLEPYLGAYGHLVALRKGDLAYLHVHPAGGPGDGITEPGPEISFQAEVPSPATYRVFLDFQHQGVVRTAQFTVDAEAGR